MAGVVDADVDDGPLIERRLVVRVGGGDPDLQAEFLVLVQYSKTLSVMPFAAPSRRFAGESLKVGRLKVGKIGVHRGEEGEKRLLGLLQRPRLLPGLDVGKGDASAHGAVVVEVEEHREPLAPVGVDEVVA